MSNLIGNLGRRPGEGRHQYDARIKQSQNELFRTASNLRADGDNRPFFKPLGLRHHHEPQPRRYGYGRPYFMPDLYRGPVIINTRWYGRI